ncbi:hypothetical protein D3C78_1587420 [compost metagenome]
MVCSVATVSAAAFPLLFAFPSVATAALFALFSDAALSFASFPQAAKLKANTADTPANKTFF